MLSEGNNLPALLNIEAYTNIVNILDFKAEKNDLININKQVNKKPYYFNTVAEMKAYNLSVGDMVITKGYYIENDGGAAEYEIVEDNSLIEDGGIIHHISEDIYAKLIIKNNVINIRQLGAKSLDTSLIKYDIKNDILKYISYLDTTTDRIKLYIPSGA